MLLGAEARPGSKSAAYVYWGPPGTWELPFFPPLIRLGHPDTSPRPAGVALVPAGAKTERVGGTAERRKRGEVGRRREVAAPHSTDEAGEHAPVDPVEGRGRSVYGIVGGKYAGEFVP